MDEREQREAEIPLFCVECGVETVARLERGFAISSDAVLCFDCARQRGGRWDEEQARWSVEPDARGLIPLVDISER